MGTALRLTILPVFVLGPTILAVFTLWLAWWLPVVILALASAAFLGLAWVAARSDELDPSWGSLRCAGCGALALAGTVVCPRCHSLDIGDQWALLRHDRPSERHRAVRAWTTRKRDLRNQNTSGAQGPSDWTGALRFLASDLGMLMQAYIRFLCSGMSLDPDDPADMRWWGAALLLVSGGFGLLGGAAHFHSWPMGLAVLFALMTTSLAVAVAGPRAMAERDSTGIRENDARSPETREAAVALHVEVNRET